MATATPTSGSTVSLRKPVNLVKRRRRAFNVKGEILAVDWVMLHPRRLKRFTMTKYRVIARQMAFDPLYVPNATIFTRTARMASGLAGMNSGRALSA